MSIKKCHEFHWKTYENIRKRQSHNISDQQVWIKKEGGLFDVTIGVFNGAQVCEAVGNFLLCQLSKKYNKKGIGLYRDDGLGIFKNISGSKAEKKNM